MHFAIAYIYNGKSRNIEKYNINITFEDNDAYLAISIPQYKKDVLFTLYQRIIHISIPFIC